jgi:hypothetical protein
LKVSYSNYTKKKISTRQIVNILDISWKFKASYRGGAMHHSRRLPLKKVSSSNCWEGLLLLDEETKELWRSKVSLNKFKTTKYIFIDLELNKIRALYKTVGRVIRAYLPISSSKSFA